ETITCVYMQSPCLSYTYLCFFLLAPATPARYPLSLHDALPISARMATEPAYRLGWERGERKLLIVSVGTGSAPVLGHEPDDQQLDRKSTRLNSSHSQISYAVFCLKKKSRINIAYYIR